METKTRKFYPWNKHGLDVWLSQNEHRVRVISVVKKVYKDTDDYVTVVYYKEKT